VRNAFKWGTENAAAIAFLWRRWTSPGSGLSDAGEVKLAHAHDRLAFRGAHTIASQHPYYMGCVWRLRKGITRSMENILEGFGIRDHQSILLKGDLVTIEDRRKANAYTHAPSYLPSRPVLANPFEL
jgi:hypothetical protein